MGEGCLSVGVAWNATVLTWTKAVVLLLVPAMLVHAFTNAKLRLTQARSRTPSIR